MRSSKPRVLLLAETCNPQMASTPFFGYQMCRHIAERMPCELVTQIRNKPAFEALDFPAPVHFVDTEWVAGPIWKLSSAIRGPEKALTFAVALDIPSHLAFEFAAISRFGGRLLAGEFDLVHRVTPLSPTIPSVAVARSPVPVVVGPVNGGLRWPPGFGEAFVREREFLRMVRFLRWLVPYSRRTYTRAAAILAGFDHTIRGLPRAARARAVVCPDVGCFSGDLPERRPGSVMKMLFVGRLVPYKCCDVVVEAIAGSRILRSHTLTIVGDGPERPRLQEAVTRNGLAEQVGFRGWLPHAQVQGLMSDHDVFAFPTVRELGAGVVLEAMSRGMACVVADYGAPRQYAAEDRGLRVDFTDRRTLVTGTRLALERLAVDGEERLRLGVRAHTYAQRHHTWEERARRVEELYGWVLGRKVAPPDFMS